MCENEASGQQAVEPWQIVQASMAEQAGDDNPSRVARNILHALRNAGFTVSHTAAPTAPSTAQGVEEETETLENLIDAAIGARTTPPWQEQAAQQCEEWALLLSEKSAHAATAFERIQLAADAVKLRDHARAFRALLSKPAQGEG